MASEDLLILAGHAWQCLDCRQILLETPERALRGHRLTAAQRERLMALEPEHFSSAASLAEALGVEVSALYEIANHARTRLRHF